MPRSLARLSVPASSHRNLSSASSSPILQSLIFGYTQAETKAAAFRCSKHDPVHPRPTHDVVSSAPMGEKTMITARLTSFAFAIALLVGAAPGTAQVPAQLDCARLAPTVQRAASEMSTLLPVVEKTDIYSLKGKVSGELEQAVTAHDQARRALLGPLREYRDSLEELAHLLQRCAR